MKTFIKYSLGTLIIVVLFLGAFSSFDTSSNVNLKATVTSFLAPATAVAWDGWSSGCADCVQPKRTYNADCNKFVYPGESCTPVVPPPPRPPTPKPTCSISASASSIVDGGSSTLSWISSNAYLASITQGIGSVSVNGSRSVSPSSSTTYNLTVKGAGGSASCSTGITVTPPTVVVPTCTLSANPTSVNYNGSSNLSWTSSNATSAFINNGIGSIGINGSYSLSNLTSNKSYTLTVNGSGGSASCSTGITVTPPTVPSCTFSASPSSVNYGGSSVLSWTSSDTTSASINNGIGSVGINGAYSVSNLTSNKNYTLIVNGSGGSVTCSTSVNVAQQPQPENPTCYLNASRTSVRAGNAVTLTWGSSYTNSATLTDFGTVNTSGSSIVYPQNSRSYTLNVYGDGGSQTCTQNIEVYKVPVVTPKPSCTISSNPNSISSGNTATLTWNSYNSISATINQLGGYTALSGSRIVYPSNTTTYTMTVRSVYGDSAICSTSLGVYPRYIPPVYPQPIVRQYIPISVVPYTGPNDTIYVLGLIGLLIISLGGATIIYVTKLRRV